MAAIPPVCDFGSPAPDFSLPSTDGRIITRDDAAGPNGLLVMFICNHCPYVLSVLDRIVRDARDLQELGIGVVAICANDAEAYPADSFDKMGEMAERHDFPFPYLHDESQEVARTYGAVCTPDFFGYNNDMALQYRGRLDESRAKAADPNARRDLYLGMKQVAETGQGPQNQIASMGCSIKWKAA